METQFHTLPFVSCKNYDHHGGHHHIQREEYADPVARISSTNKRKCNQCAASHATKGA